MIAGVLPAWVPIGFAAVFGALIGSFLNVVVWRVPQGLSIVSPGSACPRCERPIAWYDNLPIVSWLLLRARCRHCAEGISIRYPLVEAATAVLFTAVAAGAVFGDLPPAVAPALLIWAAGGLALALIDVDHHRLPNVITLPAYPITAVSLLAASWVTGEWGRMLQATIGLIALGGMYLLLALAYPAGMGLGDVKLSGSLGMLLAWLGWPQLIVGGFSAFVVGGVVGVVLMLTGRAGRKSGVPFGPFMLLGAVIGIAAGPTLADLYLSLTGLS
ncbi:prepilin peptidase [Microbacterium sp. NPDC055312]